MVESVIGNGNILIPHYMFFPRWKSHFRKKILDNDHLCQIKCILHCQRLMLILAAVSNQAEWEDAQIWDRLKSTLIISSISSLGSLGNQSN